MIIPALLIILAQTQGPVPDFTGLWGAALRFGPDVRGPLIIYRTPDGWRADIAGLTVPAQPQGRSFTFTLPDNKGTLRHGHWIQWQGVATPVTLVPDGPDRWRGTITPQENRFTFYMPITRGPDGTYRTYLRNPERNQGRFIGAQRIEINGEVVRLLGTGGRDGVVSIGSYWDDGVIRLPLRGGTYDFTRVTDSSSSAFYPRGKPAPRYRYTAPLQLDDGWPVGTLEEAGISRDSIERFVQTVLERSQDSVGTLQLHSLLIARRGRLVLEEYFHGQHRDLPHDTRSASKSWTAVLIGAAMQAGIQIRLETPVYETMLGPPSPGGRGGQGVRTDPRKRAMTLEHLLTMTAGFNCDPDDTTSADEDVMDNRGIEDWFSHALNVPLVSAPGEKIFYCSLEPHLAGGMLAKVAGEPQIVLFRRLLAEPLNMRNYHLGLRDGDLYGGGGSRFTTRDFAKMAQLMLNEGRWGGKQILGREWVRQSGAPLRNLWSQQYGYLWNSIEYDYKGRKVRAIFAGGNGGQISMVIPELDLVIAYTGGNYGTRGLNAQVLLGAVN